MRKRQPKGPYAIAGYSYGAMLAFEVSKRLEADGDQVRYCGSWKLPPHIKERMRQLTGPSASPTCSTLSPSSTRIRPLCSARPCESWRKSRAPRRLSHTNALSRTRTAGSSWALARRTLLTGRLSRRACRA